MIAAGRLTIPEDLAGRVREESYASLLGYPAGRRPEGRAAALASDARTWFARRARPWSYASEHGIARTTRNRVALDDGRTFRTPRFAAMLREIEANRLVAVVISVGAELDDEVERRWRESRPDEAFCLDRFGAAAAIRLAAWVGESLRRRAAAAHRGLGPGYSPGYDGWDVVDQTSLAAGLRGSVTGGAERLRILDSGMIEPKSSLLAAFGVGVLGAAVERQWRRHPCGRCSVERCSLRARAWRSAPPRP